MFFFVLIPFFLILVFTRGFVDILWKIFHWDAMPRLYRSHSLSPKKRESGKLRRTRAKDIEATIFNLAYRFRGKITLSDIIIETGLSMKDAEEQINRMVDGIRVRMEVDENGLVLYEFPEIIARLQDGQAGQ
jgi:hypothetical protein